MDLADGDSIWISRQGFMSYAQYVCRGNTLRVNGDKDQVVLSLPHQLFSWYTALFPDMHNACQLNHHIHNSWAAHDGRDSPYAQTSAGHLFYDIYANSAQAIQNTLRPAQQMEHLPTESKARHQGSAVVEDLDYCYRWQAHQICTLHSISGNKKTPWPSRWLCLSWIADAALWSFLSSHAIKRSHTVLHFLDCRTHGHRNRVQRWMNTKAWVTEVGPMMWCMYRRVLYGDLKPADTLITEV